MRSWIVLPAAIAMTLSAPAAAQSPLGDWAGSLDVNGTALRIVVHVAQGADGLPTGTLDSPDQGTRGIPIAEIGTEDGVLSFTVPLVSGSYRGTWDEAARQWKGEWSQGGASLPLDLGVAPPPAPLPADWQAPPDAQIRALIDARISGREGTGMVLGILKPQGQRIVAGGPASGAAFDEHTVFEIGSISKVFTALILADMANKGEVSLDDPAEKYLPEGARMPERGGRKITLRDLSTHMSALPRLPANMPYGDPGDPYADYTEALLLEFLAGYELPRDIGAEAEYSNLAVGLLGYLLGRAAGSDYETLLRERITGPLGMSDTAVALSADQQRRFAPGRDEYARPAKPWMLAVLVGAGGIRSTAADMLKFAAAALNENSPIGRAMKTALAERHETGNPRAEQALGWQVVHPEPGRDVVMHGGGTGGYRSHLALEPSKGRAVIALTNSAAEPSTTDLAIHVLVGTPVAPTPPLPPAPQPVPERAEVVLPVEELDRVVGRYEFAPGVIFNVTRDGTVLRAQREGAAVGPVLPIYAEAPLRFFWKAVNAQVVFTTGEGGEVTGAVFTQDGQTMSGTKLEP